MNLDEMIKVGMADLKVGKSPDVLTTLGLGSCVGVAIYDPVTKISGLLHCMLQTVHSLEIILIKQNMQTVE